MNRTEAARIVIALCKMAGHRRLNLHGVNLSGANLRDANLRDADLRDANLSDADLSDADLRYADLRYVDLRYADLRDANLSDANLSDADLSDADLSGANLSRADLRDATLYCANLRGADLYRATLSGAHLSGSDLTGASLCCADLSDVGLRDVNLTGADLRGTCLDPTATIPPVRDKHIRAAGLELDGEWVYGWRTDRSMVVGDTEYVPRPEPYVAPWFSVSSMICHPGLYLGGREWLKSAYPSKSPVRVKCLRSELHHAGGKWRTKRLWVLDDDGGGDVKQ